MPRRRQSNAIASFLSVLFCTGLMTLFTTTFVPSQVFAQSNFRPLYLRAKLLYKQRLYVDAIKEFNKVINTTAKGKTHFGSHYYLARAYFWKPDIQKAMATLETAKGLINGNKIKQAAYQKALTQIRSLYGKLSLTPEVDPDEVGRLQVVLTPTSTFSHKHKARYYRILKKRLSKSSGMTPNAVIYLPKGEYTIKLKFNQCLQYGLFLNDKLPASVEIGSSDVSLAVKAKASCKCPGNQIVVADPKNPKKRKCSCAAGTAWVKDKGQCEAIDPPVLWPWIVGGAVIGAGAIATAIAVPIALNARPTRDFRGTGTLFTESK
jgi:tetratricopeptide (TPR) repeat protein